MTLQLIPLPYDKLEASRNVWLPFVKGIAERQGCHVEQRLADIYSGNVGIILVWDAEAKQARGLCGYSVLDRGGSPAAKLVWLTGRRSELVSLYDQLENYFRRQGCVRMVALARPGWSKDLKRWGYRLTHVEYEKAL